MPRSHGFTLLEVLVALVLLTLFSIASYRALDAVLVGEQQALAEMARWREMARAFNRMSADLGDAISGIEVEGAQLRGFRVFVEPGTATENGAPTTAAMATGIGFVFDKSLPEDESEGLMRVGYQFRDQTLFRQTWREGRLGESAGTEAALLKNIAQLEFRYLSKAEGWGMAWPANEAGKLPLALEVRLQMAAPADAPSSSGQRLRRVFKIQ